MSAIAVAADAALFTAVAVDPPTPCVESTDVLAAERTATEEAGSASPRECPILDAGIR